MSAPHGKAPPGWANDSDIEVLDQAGNELRFTAQFKGPATVVLTLALAHSG